ncbi:MAG: glycosyltransferase, partial [Acidimicrobiia bacterium]|nr:glycosyltransferase [Acidimicrobiia bacterium]
MVVDDGSCNGTPDLLRRLAGRDPRLRVVRHDVSRGVAAARNRGLDEVSTCYVAFTDDDDLWAPHKLALQLEAMHARPEAGWSCSGAVVVNEALKIIREQPPMVSGDVTSHVLSFNVLPGGASGVVADTELVRAAGGFDPRFNVFADWDLWIRLGLLSPLVTVPRPLHAYRVHSAGMSTRDTGVGAELDHLERRYRAERSERGVELERCDLEFWIGDRSQRAGRRVAAARAHLRSVGRIP